MRQAQQEAYNSGYDDGYAAGLNAGYEDGYADGLNDGAYVAYKEGYKNGRSEKASDISALFPSRDASSSGNITYVLNANTKKFHELGCSSVNQMSDKNKIYFSGTRDEAIAQGYSPCGRCKP